MKNLEINIEALEGYKELFKATGNPIFLCVYAYSKEQIKLKENNEDTSFSL